MRHHSINPPLSGLPRHHSIISLVLRTLSLCTFFVSLSLLTACTENNNPDWTEKYEEAKFYVVKFTQSGAPYKNNVMLVPNAKGQYRMRSLLNGGTCKEFFIGSSPFIRVDTTQNWYIADWKWGLLMSRNHIVIPLRWQDVRQPDAGYVKADFEMLTAGIIDRFGIVKRSDIDRLMHIEPAPAASQPGTWGHSSGGISTDHLAPVYLSRYFSAMDVPDIVDKKGDWTYTKADFVAERLRQDSLQEVYRKRLEQLIYSGMVNSVVQFVEN